MDRHLITESDNSKIARTELGNHTPEPITIVLLALNPNGLLENGDAPLSAQIWAFAKDFAFEIVSEPVFAHRRNMELTDDTPSSFPSGLNHPLMRTESLQTVCWPTRALRQLPPGTISAGGGARRPPNRKINAMPAMNPPMWAMYATPPSCPPTTLI